MNEAVNNFEDIRQPEPFDAKWYKSFDTISSQNGDIVDLIGGDSAHRAEQRKKFESGEIENPTLDYPNLDIEQVEIEESQLLQLKEAILAGEAIRPEDSVVAQAYRWRINERIAELRMLKATASGDMHRFKRYAEFVYGKPSPEIFKYTVEEVKKAAVKTIDSDIPEIKARTEQLIASLEIDDQSVTKFEKPDKETVGVVHEIMQKEYEALGLENFDADKTFTDEETVQIFEQALESLGAESWQVVITPDRTKINVSQEEQLIEIPKGREIDFLKLQKLVMHEVVMHVGRRKHGENSRLSLLGRGLDRYIQGEEGVTKVAEHGIEGTFKTFGAPELHLAIGLAIGTDGQPRNFKEVYQILENVFFLKAIRLKRDSESAKKEAKTKAWDHCVRVFRGTDCKTKGVAYPKDIVYREGAIAIWNLVNKDTNEVYKFSIGKYDQANERHLWILSQLGITDERLDDLSA
jgi:hypothetical protein